MSFIGPARPPQSPPPSDKDDDKEKVVGPARPLPPRRVMGPSCSDNDGNREENDDVPKGPAPPPSSYVKRPLGPSLADDVARESRPMGPAPPPRRVMGPRLNDDDNDAKERVSNHKVPIGPTVGPPRPSADASNDNDDSSSDEDDELSKDEQWSRVRGNTNNNSDGQGQSSNTGVGGRDDWMKSLPTDRKSGSQLQNRKFSMNQNVHVNGGVDTSGWTDTPEERERKQREMESAGAAGKPALSSKEMFAVRREKEIEESMSNYNQKYRSESLLEQHKRKERESQQSASGGGKKQQKHSHTWDRDRDMEVGKVDKSRLTQIVTESNQLNTRFSQSNTTGNKYL